MIVLLVLFQSFVFSLAFRVLRQKRLTFSQLSLDLTDYPITSSLVGVTGITILLKLGVYWKMQFVTASLISGIQPYSTVVEIDAQDGKQVFYLPQGCDYTAIMGNSGDERKAREKATFNERVILESIGKSNM